MIYLSCELVIFHQKLQNPQIPESNGGGMMWYGLVRIGVPWKPGLRGGFGKWGRVVCSFLYFFLLICLNEKILSFSSEGLQDFITNIAVAHECGSIIDFADLTY